MTALKKTEQHIRDSAGRKKHPTVASAARAAKNGTVAISGELPVHRLGFGAMQLTGRGVWGEPADRTEAIAVLRRAVELGINLIDTADSYGPYVAEELIREALSPLPRLSCNRDKGRTGPNRPRCVDPFGPPRVSPAGVRLRRLRLERIELFQLHRDRNVPAEDQFGLLSDLQREGKIRHVGLSEVGVAEIEAARRIVPIATVQNLYKLVERKYEEVLNHCTHENIGFSPWFPLATGNLVKPSTPLQNISDRLKARPSQIAIAWLLRESPLMLPIPGTSKVKHLEENASAALIKLDDALMEKLDRLSKSAPAEAA